MAKTIPTWSPEIHFAGRNQRPESLPDLRADMLGYLAAVSAMCDRNPARDPAALYRGLVLEFYRKNYFHQKGHRSEASRHA